MLETIERRGSVVVSTPPTGVRIPLGPGVILGVKTWLSTLEIVYLCFSDETLKAVGPFLVSMPGEVKDPTSLHWKCVTCRGLHILA